MVAAYLAILSAAGYGAGKLLSQLGFVRASVTTDRALIANLASGAIVLVAISLTLGSFTAVPLTWLGMLYFAGAGLMAPLLGRGSNLVSIRRIGATRNASLGMSETVFATVFAYVVLGQPLSPVALLGLAILLIGMLLFVHEAATVGSRVQIAQPGGAPELRAQFTGRWVGVFAGLISGLFFAVSGMLRKLGLDEISSSLVGTTTGSLVALGGVVLLSAARGHRSPVTRRPFKGLAPFALSGLTQAGGQLSFFFALQLGAHLGIATAFKNTAPLFTFLFSSLFMRQTEALGLHTLLLSLVVVAGAGIAVLGSS